MELKEKVQPKHTALLVIDIQKDFASPEGFRARTGGDLSQVEPMIDSLEKLIPIAEKAGVTVLYTQQIYDRNRLNSLQKEQFDLDGRKVVCDPQTEGHEFYRINPPKEAVLEKLSFSVFSNPKLQVILQQKGIKTLVVTGMDTYYCVESTIRSAFDLGYKIVVPEDCVAGNAKHKERHNRTLELVDNTFGVVVQSSDLGKLWESF